MAKMIYDTLKLLMSGSVTNDVANFIKSVINALQTLMSDDQVAVLLGVFTGIAGSLMTIYLFMDLLDKASKDMVTLEKLITTFIKWFVAMVILIYLQDLLVAMFKVAMGMYSMLANSSVKSTQQMGIQYFPGVNPDPSKWPAYNVVKESFEGAGYKNSASAVAKKISVFIGALIPMAAMYIGKIAAFLMAAGNAVIVVVRTIFAPVGIVQMFDEGQRSAGVRYLKKFFAEALTFAVILGILFAASKLQSALMVNILSGKLIYDNSMAIDHFVSRTYYYLTADYGNFKASQIDKHGKYVEYATADEVKKQSVPLNGKVLKKDVKDEYTNAPQLYDLSAIQVEAGRLYKMSPKEVLATIQSLYETHKVISYPRTQCRYVSSEKAKEFPDMLKKLLVFPELKPYVEKISVNDIKRVQADKRIVNDKEVEKESHDALLPTDKTPDLSKLSEIERQICLLIYTRLLAQFLPKLRQQKTKLFLQHGDKLFYTTGKMVIDEGWRKLYGSLKNIELPLLTEGQPVTAKEIVPDAKKTTPPKRYTDASIVDAMTNIANQIKDDALRKSLSESKGIGTSATRAQIIDEIIKAGYVDVKKKQLYITEKGKRLIESFPGIDLFKPEFSAVMDYDMKLIQRGEKDYDTVYADTLNKLRKTCEQIEQTKVSGPVSKYKCPRCHSYMKEVSWGYVCDVRNIRTSRRRKWMKSKKNHSKTIRYCGMNLKNTEDIR